MIWRTDLAGFSRVFAFFMFVLRFAFGVRLMAFARTAQHRIRQDLKIVLEQPSSSWAYKMPIMKQVIQEMALPLGRSWTLYDPIRKVTHSFYLFPIPQKHAETCRNHVPPALRKKLTTWMGCFGHDLAKCTHLLVNFRTASKLFKTN